MKAQKLVVMECEACHKPYTAYEHQQVWHSGCPSKKLTAPMPRYRPVEDK